MIHRFVNVGDEGVSDEQAVDVNEALVLTNDLADKFISRSMVVCVQL